MNTIYVISPTFLEAIYSEAQKYSFTIHGYGTSERACKGLMYANISEILGFVYACVTFPERGSKEFDDFIKFVRLCDLTKSNKKMLIVTVQPAQWLTNVLSKYKGIRFALYSDTDGVTDVTINKHIFGSILLDNFEPYKLKEEQHTDISVFQCQTLKFNPAIPQYLYEVLQPIYSMDTLENTIKFDSVMNKYNNEVSALTILRLILIEKHMGVPYVQDVRQLMAYIKQMSDKEYGCYLAILKREGVQVNGY